MNNTADRCYVCNGRSRSLCISSGKPICSSCCGSKRGTEIHCVSDCTYYPFSLKGYDLWLKTDSNLAVKMLKYTVNARGKTYFEEIARSMVFNKQNEMPAHLEETAAGAAMFYILFVERDKDGKTLADHWKSFGWEGLTNDEQVMMNSRMHCRATVIEIQKILDAQSMECIDLLDPQKGAFIIFDRNTAARAVRFARLFIWLTHYQYFSKPENNGVEIPDFIFDEFMDLVQEEFKKESKKRRDITIKDFLSKNFGMYSELTFDLSRRKNRAILKRMDMYQCRAWYKIEGKFDDVKAIFDNYPDFRVRDKYPDEKPMEGACYYSWLRRGASKTLENEMNPAFRHDDESQGVGSVGNITLSPEMMIVEVFSKQKFTFAKKMTAKYFKKSLVLHNECVVDLAKQAAKKFENDEMINEQFTEQSPIAEERVPVEIQRKIMQDFYSQHYKKFLDDHIPALDDLTPRQAAKDPGMRPKLVDLIKQHLKSIEKQNRDRNSDLNIEWILDELNLPELKNET